MNTQTRSAVGIWRARNTRMIGEHGYQVYMVLMVALVAVAPVARAVWLSATSSGGIALLSAPAAQQLTGLVVASLWAGGLLLGRDRGPALRPPFLTYALMTSDLPRSDAFRGPLLRAGALVTGATTLVAGVVASSLASRGLVDPLSIVTFTAAGAMVGVIATVAWLAGQAFPRAAVPIALGIALLGGVTALVPDLQGFTPWGWVGLAYPVNGSAFGLVPLVAATAVLVAAVPVLLNRIDAATMAAQAARWESATSHATTMDFNSATALYQRRPYIGHRARAVQPTNQLWLTFVIRDMVGAARTPGRLLVGILAVVGAGALAAFAFAPAAPGAFLGVAAGLLLFAGLGPLTDGIRHAAAIAGDLPLYGISDRHLLAIHTLFPLAIVSAALLVAAIVCSVTVGLGAALPILGSLILGVLTVATRISNALKGPLPPALLTPIPSPMGDLGAAIRLIWALDGVLLAALAGASVALLLHAPFLLVGVALAIGGVGLARWKHRP